VSGIEIQALHKKSGTRHEFGKIWPNLATTCHHRYAKKLLREKECSLKIEKFLF
jgi:hypothetical protein